MRSFCRGLLIAALATAVGAQDVVRPSAAAVCPAGLSGTTYVRGQSCYEFGEVQKTWVQARTYCHERDGRLVSITDAELQAWLSSSAAQLWPTQKGVWIGLNDRSTSGVFVWDDYGTIAEHRMSYSNWANGSPRNGWISGDCVHMRSDNNWQWLESACDSVLSLYIYKYICEYRVATLNVTATTIGHPAITSVAGVTLSVATEFHSAILSSSANSDATRDAGAMAGKNDVTLPLSVSLAVAVVVVAMVALAVVVWRRRQQRSRPPKGSIVVWTRMNGDERIMVGNPMYGDSTQLVMDQTSVAHGSGNDAVSGRPVSNIYADMSSVVPAVDNQKDGAVDHRRSIRDMEPTYAEPLMEEPSTAKAAEPSTPYHLYTYIDSATFQKLTQPGTSIDVASSADKKPGPAKTDPGQQCSQAQQLNGSRSTQDGYEPFISHWTPYENVQKPAA